MKLVPLFPLEIIVFPYESLNLHIFEPRYKQLIEDCKEDEMQFGIPYFRKDHPLKFGTLVQLEEISQVYPDGKMDIKTNGVKPFELKRYRVQYPDKLYPGGYVEELYWESEGNEDLRKQIRTLLTELYEYMKIDKRLEPLDRDFITYEIAHKVGYNKSQEYEFLQIISETERQKHMIDHLIRIIPVIKEMEEMRKKVQLNGHFKYLQPPEI